MNLNYSHLGLVLFIGAIVGLALNPYVDTPLNPVKEVTTTTTSISTTTLPQITSTSSTTLTETSTSITISSTTLTKSSTTTSTITSRSTATVTTTNSITLTTTSTTTNIFTTTMISISTETKSVTTTTTIDDNSVWDRWGMRIKQPEYPNYIVMSEETDTENGYVTWYWDNYWRRLDILWSMSNNPTYEDNFQNTIKEYLRDYIVTIVEKGQMQIDDKIWEYQIVSYNNQGTIVYLVDVVGFYPELSMSYWISYETPNSNVLNEMMVYGSTFIVIHPQDKQL